MDEVIDDLISLESGFNDGGLDCMESNIIMQNNVSINHINCCTNSYRLTLSKLLQTIYGMKVFYIDFSNITSVNLFTLFAIMLCQVT